MDFDYEDEIILSNSVCECNCEFEVVKQTPKAVLIEFKPSNHQQWLPLTHIQLSDILQVEYWLIERNNLYEWFTEPGEV